MKVWVTKWALTEGILEGEGDIQYPSGIMFVYRGRGEYVGREMGRDWHMTLEGAHIQAAKLRNRRIASLRKQIKLLEELQIKVVT